MEVAPIGWEGTTVERHAYWWVIVGIAPAGWSQQVWNGRGQCRELRVAPARWDGPQWRAGWLRATGMGEGHGGRGHVQGQLGYGRCALASTVGTSHRWHQRRNAYEVVVCGGRRMSGCTNVEKKNRTHDHMTGSSINFIKSVASRLMVATNYKTCHKDYQTSEVIN